ncbi:MAG: hypothetical protein ACRCZF_25810, partial [Gemmataceae bacterium]
YYYGHGFGPDVGYAITGGVFYPETPLAGFQTEYFGQYFYADFVTNWIRVLNPSTGESSAFAPEITGIGIVDLDVAPNGDLYYLARGNSYGIGDVGEFTGGGIYRIRQTNTPLIHVQPATVTVLTGTSATFRVQANGTGTLTYQWQRDGVDIPGANAAAFTLPVVSASDQRSQFRVRVRNTFGGITSQTATLNVTTDSAPAPTILSPVLGTTIASGNVLNFSGQATDAEDGVLPASAFTWRVDYYTGKAPPRPLLPETTGIQSGSVLIPASTPYTRSDVFYRVVLTVRDSGGNAVTTVRDVDPIISQVTLTSNIVGSTLTLDSQIVAAPHAFLGVAGVLRTIQAPAVVMLGNRAWTFEKWSDGSTERTRTIATPTVTTTFSALYIPPLNRLPTLSVISDQMGFQNESVGPLGITIGDGETPSSDLLLSATTTNAALFPVGNIAFGGTGANRTIVLTPLDNAIGNASITITVRDEDGGTTSRSFTVTIDEP